MIGWIIVTVAGLILSSLLYLGSLDARDGDALTGFFFCIVAGTAVGGLMLGAKIGGIGGGIACFFGTVLILGGILKVMDNNNAKMHPEKKKEFVDYTQVIRLNPGSGDALNERGYAYQAIGRHKKAIEDFNAAIKLDSQNYLYYGNRAYSHEKLKEYDKAIPDYREAIRLKPDNTWAIERLDGVCDSVKNYGGGIFPMGVGSALALAAGAVYSGVKTGGAAGWFSGVSGIAVAAGIFIYTVYFTGRRNAAKRMIDV